MIIKKKCENCKHWLRIGEEDWGDCKAKLLIWDKVVFSKEGTLIDTPDIETFKDFRCKYYGKRKN